MTYMNTTDRDFPSLHYTLEGFVPKMAYFINILEYHIRTEFCQRFLVVIFWLDTIYLEGKLHIGYYIGKRWLIRWIGGHSHT